MKINELLLQLWMALIVVLYLLANNRAQFPIVELMLVIIFVSVYHLSVYGYERCAFKPQWFVILMRLCYFSAVIAALAFVPSLFLMLPVLFFSASWDYKWLMVEGIGVIILGMILSYSVYHVLMVLGLCYLTALMGRVIRERRTFTAETYEEIDTLRALNERVNIEQAQLIKLQDERIQTSVLSERKRIVGEIHDILGHQISSAVIQVGALKYLVEDEEVEKNLAEIQEVLTSSMNNVREVIHRERETSIDIHHEMQQIAKEFTKAKIKVTYHGQSLLSNHVSHSLINILKEALTNINKHSNATQVTVHLTEMEDRWTYLIADNGTQISNPQTSSGVGLINIEERLHQLKGTVHFNTDNGFRIFMTIPKEKEGA